MKRSGHTIMVLLCAFVALVCIIGVRVREKGKTYTINREEIDNAADAIIVDEVDGYTGRFPDIIRTKDGILVAYYWNNEHAPYNVGDSLGTIRIKRGSPDGLTWESAVDLIDEDFLISNNMGLWNSPAGYHNNIIDADNSMAEFCVEARDPNFARMGEYIVLTFFTRLPWDINIGEHTYLQYDENYDYTYGRTYIMVSKDEGETWSEPVEVHSNYLNKGCAKRGNIAILDDHTVLIPLYGFSTELGGTFTTANILASYEDGKWLFKREYATHIKDGVEEVGAFEKGISEVSFTVFKKDIYALLRPTGDVLVSKNKGESWEMVKSEGRDKDFTLHQPSLYTIEASNQILASWSEPNEIGGRDIFLLLYTPEKDNVWRYGDKYCIYKTFKGGTWQIQPVFLRKMATF